MDAEILSVIVLTYKHGALLLEAIDSVLRQDYPKIQLIIAEDGAKDFDEEAVRRYAVGHADTNLVDVQIMHPTTNAGTVRNLNKALKKVKGKYVKIIAGDDTYSQSDVFSKQVDYLRENQDKYLVFGNVVECDAYMKPVQTQNSQGEAISRVVCESRNEMLRYFCKVNSSFMATQSICFRKVFFEKFGEYDERFKLIEDLPMVSRIIIENIPFGYQNISCVNHRGCVGVSTSNNPFEPSKIPYYKDLLSFYDLILDPVKDIVGRTFVNMRRALIAFRIDYSQVKANGGSKSERFRLIVKNIAPIGYYAFSKFGRFLNYIKH